MKTYLHKADILLPKKNFEKWSVIACDQYTSDKKYWEETERIVGDTPSALHIILPEIYLEETEQRVEKINANMSKYLSSDVFDIYNSAFVYVEREITDGKIRRGLVGMIDLEEYDYTGNKKTLIRSTEQTVAERIPPRVKIRRNAPLEMPHVMLFINDSENLVLGSISKNTDNLKKLYDFKLMQKGGNIEGYLVEGEKCDRVNEALDKLAQDGFVFAVGDGNHSLATAKECYNLNKDEASRYALVEIVNIYDESIEFEPIYRVLFNCDREHLLSEMKKNLKVCRCGRDLHTFEIISKGAVEKIKVRPTAKLPVGTLQTFLDDYIAKNPTVRIDYIHGIEDTKKLCENDNTIGFLFDGMKKDELFSAVEADGSLPRKTFSMGHADDKRFYMECRRLK